MAQVPAEQDFPPVQLPKRGTVPEDEAAVVAAGFADVARVVLLAAA